MTLSSQTIHAGCVLLKESGVLLVGESGAGKSTLARFLVETTLTSRCFAAYVSDDRTQLSRHGGLVVARPHALIAGQMELRGIGLIAVASESAAVLRLLVELTPKASRRMPDEEVHPLLGVELPIIKLDSRAGIAENAELVRVQLGLLALI